MGRRNKTAALNQVTPKPVATPEQIEEMQTEAAKMIAEYVDEQIQEDLKNLANKEPAKLLAPELESVVPLAESPVESEEIQILQDGAGLVYGEDYVDDPTIERKLVDKSVKEKPEETVVSTGSVANQRMKLRIGSKRR